MILRPEAEVEILDVRQDHDGLDIEDKPVDLVLRMLDEDILVMRPLSVLRKNEYLKTTDGLHYDCSREWPSHPLFELIPAKWKELRDVLVVKRHCPTICHAPPTLECIACVISAMLEALDAETTDRSRTCFVCTHLRRRRKQVVEAKEASGFLRWYEMGGRH